MPRLATRIVTVAVVALLLGSLGSFGPVPPTAVALAAGADEYEVTTILPTTGHNRSKAFGINNLGQVVGRAHNYDAGNDKDIDREAFIWDSTNGIVVLPTLNGETSAWGVNDSGFVSGFSFNSAGYQRVVRWNSSALTLVDIGTLVNPVSAQSGDSSTAYDINNSGQVVGHSDIPNEAGDFIPFHAFLYSDASGIEDLGTLDSTWPEYQYGYSIAYDINDNEQVVGLAHNSAWEYRPILYDPTNGMQELTRDPAYASDEWYAVAINSTGMIGGHVAVADDRSYPYYWTTPSADPTAVTMPAEFPYGEIYSINASGVMVGVMWNDAGLEHAFVLDTTNGLRDLNDLIATGSGWVLAYARDINDSGQIVGFGELSGQVRAFVLTPGSSPTTGQIVGTVIDELTGMPIVSVQVDFFDNTGSWVADAVTDGNGSYSSIPLPAGNYYASTTNGKSYMDELYNNIPCNGCDPTAGSPITVTGGSNTIVDFYLTDVEQPPVTVYGSAESGTTEGWRVYDATPAGATIQNVWDATRQSNVIEVSGSGTDNGYELRNADGSKWHNQSQFIIEWSMAYSESFAVFIDVETSAGHRYMKYTPVDWDLLGSATYIHHGLGSTTTDGQWHTFTRNLEADLDEAQPGVTLLEVNAFLIRGSGRVADVKLWSNLHDSVYEDAENGNTDGWQVYDNDPSGATIQNVYDATRQSNVIELSGSGVQNGYMLRNPDGSKWHNQSQFIIQWSMSSTDGFKVYIDVWTSAGQRYMQYEAVNANNLGSGTYIQHGLGSAANDGTWRTFARDLEADLEEAQPGVTLLEVNGFLIRGNARVDDVKLLSTLPATVYEDAEHGTTDGWRIYDANPGGATILNVYDDVRQSQVIELSGSAKDNGYELRNPDGSPWYNQSQFYIQWSMRYYEAFTVYVDVETSAGHRYLYYTPMDQNWLGSSEYVHHGVGSNTTDGEWHTITRDLRADLEDAQPGVTLLEVNGFFIRGSGRVDDIKLWTALPTVVYEDAEDDQTNGWSVYDNNPGGAYIQNVYDATRQSQVIELVGSGRDNGYKLGNETGNPWHNKDLFTIEWSSSYSEAFTVYVQVQTSEGMRYLHYTPVDSDYLGASTYVHHGVGSNAADGRWRTFVRDLQADLSEGQPGVAILEVNGFYIRGSGRVDDIRLRSN